MNQYFIRGTEICLSVPWLGTAEKEMSLVCAGNTMIKDEGA